jgi:hypothetical protein
VADPVAVVPDTRVSRRSRMTTKCGNRRNRDGVEFCLVRRRSDRFARLDRRVQELRPVHLRQTSRRERPWKIRWIHCSPSSMMEYRGLVAIRRVPATGTFAPRAACFALERTFSPHSHGTRTFSPLPLRTRRPSRRSAQRRFPSSAQFRVGPPSPTAAESLLFRRGVRTQSSRVRRTSRSCNRRANFSGAGRRVGPGSDDRRGRARDFRPAGAVARASVFPKDRETRWVIE